MSNVTFYTIDGNGRNVIREESFQEVLEAALKHNVAALILAHNHASGIADPHKPTSTSPSSARKLEVHRH